MIQSFKLPRSNVSDKNLSLPDGKDTLPSSIKSHEFILSAPARHDVIIYSVHRNEDSSQQACLLINSPINTLHIGQ